jgi:1,5-anhydro-D-fructose reductase (1,5-anhydro-D-mannitol-forming)
MTTTPTIRWGILGCGDVCEVKSGPGFQQIEGSALTMVMRRTPMMAEEYATRHGVPNWTGHPDDLIEDPDVDAVYIATPPGSHMEYALKVCAAGKPCYVEKPMARSGAECDRMVKAFAEAGVPLFVAYYRRGLPRFLKAKELIDAGALGAIRTVNYRMQKAASPDHDLGWRVQAEHAGGGLFLDLGSHTLDILDYLLGPLLNAAGEAHHAGSPYDVEDAVALRFTTEHGVQGTASWNFTGIDQKDLVPWAFDGVEHADLITITGEQGELLLSTFGNEPVRFKTNDREETFDLPNPKTIHQPLIQTIVDSLNGNGTCPSTGETAARTSHIMDAALQGYYGGRADDFWTRPDTWPGKR